MARTIPSLPHPSSIAVDLPSGRMSYEWFKKLDEIVKALQRQIPVSGTVTFASATSATVTFANVEQSTSYNVHYDAPEQRTVWTTNKATTGFTANVSATTSATYGYTIVRR